MKTLFIDTHSDKLTVIIRKDEEEKLIENMSDRSHSEIAMPSIVQVFDEAKITPEELDEIIVVCGPGSFTGVRIGVTIAKTLAYSLNIPIKTITSLEMYGVSSSEDADIVTVKDSKGVYSARRGLEYTDFMYQRNQEFLEYIAQNDFKVLNEKKIDLDKILDYLKDKKFLSPHEVNPIYIKEIDALK